MQSRFNEYIRKVLEEITTPKNKRREHTSRYFGDGQYAMASTPRKVQSTGIKTASQKTKLGYQQYMGGPFAKKGVRGINQSQKNPQEIAIAKGLGGYIKPEGKNPKQIGAQVNSKQNNMEIKYNLANGVAKVGSNIDGAHEDEKTVRQFQDDREQWLKKHS